MAFAGGIGGFIGGLGAQAGVVGGLLGRSESKMADRQRIRDQALRTATLPWRGVNLSPVRLADDETYGFVALGMAHTVVVRVAGIPLHCVADFANTECLRGAMLRAGEFATCLQHKTLRLGAVPAHPVTYDVDCL